MDASEITQQMKILKAKARIARKEGKQAIAQSFKTGAERLRRRVARLPKAIAAVVASAE